MVGFVLLAAHGVILILLFIHRTHTNHLTIYQELATFYHYVYLKSSYICKIHKRKQYIFTCLFAVLGIKPKTLRILGKHSIRELHIQLETHSVYKAGCTNTQEEPGISTPKTFACSVTIRSVTLLTPCPL